MNARIFLLSVVVVFSCTSKSGPAGDGGPETPNVPTGVAPNPNVPVAPQGGTAGAPPTGTPATGTPAVAGVPPATSGAGATGSVPAGQAATATEGLSKSKVYMVSSTSAAVAPGDSKVVSVSCQQGGDMLMEHRCATDSKCGAIFEDGIVAKEGESDSTSCGARNTCGKGTITITVTAACYHF